MRNLLIALVLAGSLYGAWSLYGSADAVESVGKLKLRCKAISTYAPDKPHNASDYNYCLGYISGVHEAFAMNRIKYFCVPDSLGALKISRKVIKFLEENPESIHVSSASAVLEGLQKKFPCPSVKNNDSLETLRAKRKSLVLQYKGLNSLEEKYQIRNKVIHLDELINRKQGD